MIDRIRHALPVILLIIRLTLGSLFIYSGLPKILLPYDFLSSVYSYELVGPRVGLLVAAVLPWLEFLTGVGLIGGLFVGGALLASAAMSVMFAIAVSYALIQGLDISCGCFSTSSKGSVSYLTLIRAIVIFFVSVAAYAGLFLQTGYSRAREG